MNLLQKDFKTHYIAGVTKLLQNLTLLSMQSSISRQMFITSCDLITFLNVLFVMKFKDLNCDLHKSTAGLKTVIQKMENI